MSLALDDIEALVAEERGKADVPAAPAFEPFAIAPLPRRPASQIPPREPLLAKRPYMRGVLSLSAGIGGGGKGLFSLADAVSAATGRDLLGVALRAEDYQYGLGDVPPTLLGKPLKVWFHTEDSEEEVERRRMALLLHYGMAGNERIERLLDENLYVTSSTKNPVRIATQGSKGVVIDKAAVEFVRRTIIENRIDLVLFDSLATLHNVNENDNSAMEQLMRELLRLAETEFEVRWTEKVERRARKGEVERVRARRPAIDVTMHTSKAGASSDGDDENALRGASATVYAARAARRLQRMSKEEAEKVGIDPLQRRRFVYYTNAKANYLPPMDARDWFMLASVDIGNGNDEYPTGDSVGVVRPWLRPQAASEEQATVALRALKNAPEEQRRAAVQAGPAWAGEVVRKALGLPADEAGTRRVTAILRQLLAEKRIKRRETEVAHRKSAPVWEVATGAGLAQPDEGDEE